MFSKILLKLLQESLFPIFGYIVIKVLVTVISATNLGYTVNLSNIFILEVSLDHYKIINSDILLWFAIFSFLGMTYSLIKSLYFHNTHISPRTTMSLFNFRVRFLIQDSFHLFSQSVVWLVFNYIIGFLALFLFYLGLTSLYLVIISTLFSLIATYLLALDIEYEIEKEEMDSLPEVFVDENA